MLLVGASARADDEAAPAPKKHHKHKDATAASAEPAPAEPPAAKEEAAAPAAAAPPLRHCGIFLRDECRPGKADLAGPYGSGDWRLDDPGR